MSPLLAGLLLVPLVDQGIKLFLLQCVGRRSISLGLLGRVEVVQTRFWLARLSRQAPRFLWWGAWSLAAGALATATVMAPRCGWFVGLLLGGSLSHLLESSLRGWICDFVRLRFWPAFNLADVAICAGALGLAAEAVVLIAHASS